MLVVVFKFCSIFVVFRYKKNKEALRALLFGIERLFLHEAKNGTHKKFKQQLSFMFIMVLWHVPPTGICTDAFRYDRLDFHHFVASRLPSQRAPSFFS